MNLGELSGVKLLGVLVLVAAVGTTGLYYTVFKSQRDQNAAAQIKLQAKLRENAELEAYRPKLAGVLNNLAILCANTGRRAEAKAAYEEALTIRRTTA